MNHFVRSLIWILKWWRTTRKLNKSHRSWHEEVIPLSNQWWRITRKLNKSHRSWHEEVIPLSNQVIQVSQFGNSTASSSFQSNQDESLCEKLDLGYIKWWRITMKLNKSHRSWHEEVIPLSNQVIPVSQFGNSTASSSFQSNQDESICKRLDLDT
ncbi:hypothetical protein Bca4012_103393 [Brassica carinata]